MMLSSHKKSYPTVWIIALICLSVLVRVVLLPVANGDYNHYLKPWIDFIRENGYFHALKYDFYNYTPSYIYTLIGVAKTGWNSLYAIKAVTYLFEYLTAYIIGRIAYMKWQDRRVVWASMAIMPLLPSTILNSTCLTQCDAIYAAFAVGSIYFALKGKPWTSVLFLGGAFSFKLQTVMVLPFFFVMLLRRKIKWYCFFVVPLVYFVSILPAWIAGRPLDGLLHIYFSQAGYYHVLTMFFPNIYIWMNDAYFDLIVPIGIATTCAVTLLCGWLLSRQQYVFSFDAWVRLAFVGAIIVPFLLPGMHERYMYVGDVLGVLYFLVIRKNVLLSLGIAAISAYSYIRCSRFNEMLPQEPAFFLYLLIIALVVADFVQSLKTDKRDVTCEHS